MTDEYFLDYDGADTATTRFSRRAADLAGGAGEVLPQASPFDFTQLLDSALHAAGQLERAFSGRLFAYSDELSVMSRHVSGAVRVTNDVDVDLTLAP